MDECIDSLEDTAIFSTLDVDSGYWHIKMAPEDCDKTAFAPNYGLLRLTRMPVKLENTPGAFQRVIDVIFSTVKWQFALLIYLDGVVVCSNSLSRHFEDVRCVLTFFHGAGVTLKLKK